MEYVMKNGIKNSTENGPGYRAVYNVVQIYSKGFNSVPRYVPVRRRYVAVRFEYVIVRVVYVIAVVSGHGSG